MTDRQLSVEVERLVRLAGGLGIFRVFGRSMEVFMGSLLAGDNAAAPSPYDFALGGCRARCLTARQRQRLAHTPPGRASWSTWAGTSMAIWAT